MYNEAVIQSIENGTTSGKTGDSNEDEDADPILNEAIDLVVDMGQASASMLQRRFKIGYSRAGRIVDQMEARGLISGYEGSKPRQVLISKAEWQELKLGNSTESSNDDSSEAEKVLDNMAKTEQAMNSTIIQDNNQNLKRSKYDIEL